MVRARTYLGEKVEYEVELGGQVPHVVQFDPAEAEGFAPGEAVSLGIPEDRVRLPKVDSQGPRP